MRIVHVQRHPWLRTEAWRAVVAALTLSTACAANAQRVEFAPWITARLTASDNAGLGSSTAGRDLIGDLTVGTAIRADWARLSLFGSAALESFVYARHTQGNDVVPLVDLTGRWIAVERFLFVEAGARTTQSHIDPYSPGLTTTSTDNNETITQYRLSPYIESDPLPNLHFRARSDNTISKDYGERTAEFEAVDDSYFGFHTISLEKDPVPLGWRLEAERSYTRYQGEFAPLITDIGRALVNVAVLDTTRIGIRVGAEKGNYLTDPGWHPIYGGQFGWHPSERTAFDFDIEHRFFGNAVHLNFTHRMQRLAWSFRASRDLETAPQSIFDLGPTGNVAALLDSILISRFPNPADRATQVQNIIARQGLPASTTTVIPILAQRLSVAEDVSLGVAYLGARDTLTLTLNAGRTRDALEEGPLATDSPVTNNLQRGATVAYVRQLTPTSVAGLTVSFSRIDSLETATAADSSKDGSVVAHWAVQVSPRTTALFGAEQRKVVSNVTSRETSVFVEVDHRF
jgi:uncharacterized protein (PEP-CTERM system associated)